MLKRKIMLVDSDHVYLQSLRDALSKAGFQVSTYTSAMAARTNMKNEMPELIVSEIPMVPMDGITFAQGLGLKEEYKRIPIFFLTTIDNAQNRDMAKKLGALGYEPKPENIQSALTSIRRCIARIPPSGAST